MADALMAVAHNPGEPQTYVYMPYFNYRATRWGVCSMICGICICRGPACFAGAWETGEPAGHLHLVANACPVNNRRRVRYLQTPSAHLVFVEKVVCRHCSLLLLQFSVLQ